jgi:DNA replication and repair protein RecF
MQIKRLVLFNFRNYTETSIDFSDGVNVVYGDNGAGKTTILEAIYYLALTKSFRASTDKYLIKNGAEMCRVQGEFVDTRGKSVHSTLAYSLKQGKHLTVNGQKMGVFSEYIGEIPVVLLHPQDLQLSQGSPQMRRRFLDVLLSQSSKVYLHHLMQYNRSLKQRNQLLQQPDCDPQLLTSWEENLIQHGVAIIQKRREVVALLSEQVKQYYRLLSRKNDSGKIVYQCNVAHADGDPVAAYRAAFDAKRHQEKELGTTIVGPHRDDLLFLLNGKAMKTYASQGEHKTWVIALKLSEYRHLAEQQQRAPILLFDDIFGELDAGRIQQMLAQLNNIGQVFVTTTSRNFFDKIHRLNLPTHYYHVQNGKVASA